MKKILTFIAVAVFIIYPSICFASYIIHLKDGREFATDRYYEEGNQIKFKRYGGVIGIRKDLVREIEVVEDVGELPEVKEKAEPAKEDVSQSAKKQGANKEGAVEAEGKVKAGKEEVPEKVAKEQGAKQVKEQEKPEEASEEEKKNAEQEKTAKMQAFLEEKRQIMREMEIVNSAFKEAKARNDKKGSREQFKKLLPLREKLRELDEKVKAAYGGQLPKWWSNLE